MGASARATGLTRQDRIPKSPSGRMERGLGMGGRRCTILVEMGEMGCVYIMR